MHSECNQNRGVFCVCYVQNTACDKCIVWIYSELLFDKSKKKKPTVSVVAVKVCAMTIVVYMYIECVC